MVAALLATKAARVALRGCVLCRGAGRLDYVDKLATKSEIVLARGPVRVFLFFSVYATICGAGPCRGVTACHQCMSALRSPVTLLY